MYEYIKGELNEIAPTQAVIETAGVGYVAQISLQTYEAIRASKQLVLYIHLIVREDAHILFGFADKTEREVFRLLIDVNGIGPNTARVILSSLTASELCTAIERDDLNKLKSVKGIGLKTAQRMLVDLKDKVARLSGIDYQNSASSLPGTRSVEEARSALLTLGFAKAPVDKTLDALLVENSGYTVEELIKLALKRL